MDDPENDDELEDVDMEGKDGDDNEDGTGEDEQGDESRFKSKKKVRASQKPIRSVLYYVKGYEGGLSLTPVQLPPLCRIAQVSR